MSNAETDTAEVPKLPDLPDIDTLGPSLLLVLPVQMSERALESLKHILGHFSGSLGPTVKYNLSNHSRILQRIHFSSHKQIYLMIFSKICLPTFFGPAGFILDQLKSDTAGPNVRHSSQSFRNLWKQKKIHGGRGGANEIRCRVPSLTKGWVQEGVLGGLPRKIFKM